MKLVVDIPGCNLNLNSEDFECIADDIETYFDEVYGLELNVTVTKEQD